MAKDVTTKDVFATVGKREITVQEYAMALRSESRRRFYHAKPPEDVLAAFRREVADQLVDRALAVQEASRRGIRLNRSAINEQLAKYAARATSNRPGHSDKAFVAALRGELEQEQLVAQLRQQVRAGIVANESQLREYFRSNPDKFTEPKRLRISVILLRVAPSAPQVSWDAARAEATQIARRLKSGADFSELARVHSSDKSAEQGGDMGYIHKGMLSVEVEEALEKLSTGGVTEPLTVLEGLALFKLNDKRPAQLAEFSQVKSRARDLWVKEEESRVWTALVKRLRATTNIRVEEKYLSPG